MVVREGEKIIFYEPARRFTPGDVILTLYGAGMVVLSIYWIFNPPDDAPFWAFIFLGVLHVFFALFSIFIYYSDRYTATIDSELRKVIIDRKGFFGSSTEEYNFEQIQSFHIVQNFDPDTVAGWDVEMELKTGERQAVPNSFAGDEKAYEEIVQTVNNYLTD